MLSIVLSQFCRTMAFFTATPTVYCLRPQTGSKRPGARSPVTKSSLLPLSIFHAPFGRSAKVHKAATKGERASEGLVISKAVAFSTTAFPHVEITQVKQHPPSAQPFILQKCPGQNAISNHFFPLESTSKASKAGRKCQPDLSNEWEPLQILI